jgi:hypothetical protein
MGIALSDIQRFLDVPLAHCTYGTLILRHDQIGLKIRE